MWARQLVEQQVGSCIHRVERERADYCGGGQHIPGVADRAAVLDTVEVEIELADAVAALRDELIEAAARHGPGQQVGFKVGPIDLEFAVELRADAKAKAGFKAWVLSADAEVGAARARTHKVKLTVTPTTPDGGDLMIAGDAARAPGPGVRGEDELHR